MKNPTYSEGSDNTFMARLVIFLFTCMLILLCSRAFSQTWYGFNGTHTAENLTTEVIGLLNPMTPRRDTVVYVIRDDKNPESMPQMQVDNIIAYNNSLKDSNKTLLIVYTFDCLKKTIAQNFYGYNALRSAGLKIVAVRMDNESYADSAGFHSSYSEYKTHYTPVVNEVRRLGNYGKILLSVAPRPGNSVIPGGVAMHKVWNDLLAIDINANSDYDCDFHLYYNKSDASILGTLMHDKLPVSLFDGITYLGDKDAFFKALMQQITASQLLDKTMEYLRSKFPGKGYWMTEWGTYISTGNLNNTIASAIANLWFLNQTLRFEDIKAVCKFNGPTNPMTGLISSRTRFDLAMTLYVKRLDYYVLQLFMKYRRDKEYRFFVNEPSAPLVIDPAAQYDVVGIWGQHYYTFSGSVEWEADGSVKSPTIDAAHATSFPALGCGYYKIIPPPQFDTIITCRDSSYQYPTFQVAYIDVTDTIVKPQCRKCVDFFYRVFHINSCKTCEVHCCTYEHHTDTIIQVILHDTTVALCDTSIQLPHDPPSGIQPLDADTLRFYGEQDFHDFLVFYGLTNDYQIIPPKYFYDCHALPSPSLYPDQINDDYLHQERFDGMGFVALRDHIGTRKMLNVFLPSLNDPRADFCGVTEWYTNPSTGQVVEFHNVYTWWDYRGEQMFNTNLKLWLLWQFPSGVTSFPIDAIHEATGYDYTFVSEFPGHETMELNFNNMKTTYGFLLPN